MVSAATVGPSSFTEYARDHLVRGQRRIDSWTGHHYIPHQHHHSYLPRHGHLTISRPFSSSFDSHLHTDLHSPASGSSRRVTSASPASHSLSPENQWRRHSSDSTDQATAVVLSRHRPSGAYHSSNYLRPLSMNYPAHRHLICTSQTSGSGKLYRSQTWKDAGEHRSATSSRSPSSDRGTGGQHHSSLSLPRYRAWSHRPGRSSSSPLGTVTPSTTIRTTSDYTTPNTTTRTTQDYTTPSTTTTIRTRSDYTSETRFDPSTGTMTSSYTRGSSTVKEVDKAFKSRGDN